MSGCDAPKRYPDVLAITQEGGYVEASDRLDGAVAALTMLAQNFPSRELSLAITNAQQAQLWLGQAAPVRDDCEGGR